MNSSIRHLFFFLLLALATNAYAVPTVESNEPIRTTNIRVNPLGLLLGGLSGDVDFRLGEKFTLGPSLSYLRASSLFTTLQGFGIGVRANWYLSGMAMTDSWYVGPGLGYSHFSVEALDEKASVGAFYVGSVVGYQWVWTSGLNLNVGLGANWYSNSKEAVAESGSKLDVPFLHGLVPSGELTLGYAF